MDILRKIASIMGMALISIITVVNIRGDIRTAVVIFFIIQYAIQPLKIQIGLLFFITAFTSDLGVSFGIPAISIMQAISILCYVINRKVVDIKYILCVVFLLVSQSVCMITNSQSLQNIVVFLVNITLMYVVFSTFDGCEKREYDLNLILFIFGICVALTAGLVRLGENTQYWERFQGIWTDPNFLGLFVILALTCLIQLVGYNLKKLVICSPIIFLLLYSGYLTKSRSFLFACVIVLIVLMVTILRNEEMTLGNKIFIVGAFLILSYFVYNTMLQEIILERGLSSSEGVDWTNGRLYDTAQVLKVWSLNIGNIMFGFGADNSASITGFVAHNTYADILFELGIIGAPVFIYFIGYLLFQNKFSARKIGIFIFLFYCAALSMLSFDALYLFIGLLSTDNYEQVLENEEENDGAFYSDS